MWLLLIVLALLALVVLFLCLPVEISLDYERMHADDSASIEIRTLMGLVRVRRELTKLEATQTEDGPAVVAHGKQGHDGATDEGGVSAADVPRRWDQIREIVGFIKRALRIAKHTSPHIHIYNVRVEAHVGVNDSVQTGMLVGTMYAGISTFLGWLSHQCKLVDRPYIQVRPAFHQTLFHLRTQSILRIRMGYVISAGIRLLVAWKRRAF
ncbi:hypothetical protein C7445_11199 [Alicyclobacillus sacchari]|uniref:DUF2953 family protein n=1 Tax=Alicyclobacillus sacchari TaxID=392010 RepID=A0A4R8LLK4_9BACL|nr:DUF2953 domain-containing protein [Alicyclobacillus sacchari]TDY43451.1 hypothetical protein C7445_11199 [Alicyclobacillus sacchari]GMA55792.1 hypothetical protein GCM10025858_02950 [Alicyclobacillus sacchari]